MFCAIFYMEYEQSLRALNRYDKDVVCRYGQSQFCYGTIARADNNLLDEDESLFVVSFRHGPIIPLKEIIDIRGSAGIMLFGNGHNGNGWDYPKKIGRASCRERV